MGAHHDIRVALVAGGGAVKAYAFHLGVVRGLEEDGFGFEAGLRRRPILAGAGRRRINLYVGSSAGACVVASLASGRTLDELSHAVLGTSRSVPHFGYRTLFVPELPSARRYFSGLVRRWRVGSLRPHHLVEPGGLLSTAGVERFFRRVLPSNDFADLVAPLYVVSTPVNGSRKVVFAPHAPLDDTDESCTYLCGVPISEAIAAAVAVPPIFAPYPVRDPHSDEVIDCYDGEVRETLSADVARHAGADFVIASSIWQPYSFDARVGSLAGLGMSALVGQALHQSLSEKVDFDRRLAERHDRALEVLEEHARRHGLAPDALEALVKQVSRELHHRPTPTLYVVPEDGDAAFFFESSFRFNRKLLERCIDAGHRAYRQAVARSPGFLRALDEHLAGSTPGARRAETWSWAKGAVDGRTATAAGKRS